MVETGHRVGEIRGVALGQTEQFHIFGEHMQTFLKGKQEAKATDRKSRGKCIRDHQTDQGILLEDDKSQINLADQKSKT